MMNTRLKRKEKRKLSALFYQSRAGISSVCELILSPLQEYVFLIGLLVPLLKLLYRDAMS